MSHHSVAFGLAAGIFFTCMIAVAQEADKKRPGPPPAAVAVKIKKLEMIEAVPGRDAINALIVFDKKVPNGGATLVVDISPALKARLSLWPVSEGPDGNRVKIGALTDRLRVQWSPSKDAVSAEQLEGRSARFYSHEYPPETRDSNNR